MKKGLIAILVVSLAVLTGIGVYAVSRSKDRSVASQPEDAADLSSEADADEEERPDPQGAGTAEDILRDLRKDEEPPVEQPEDPPADPVQRADAPPADQPPMDQPPMDQPPMDMPPADQAAMDTQPASQSEPQPSYNTPDSSPFLQYVYEEGGYTCFRYTGSGESTIVVPEGVQKIKGFTVDFYTFNSDVTTIYLPSTLLTMTNSNYFCDEAHNWDNNGYNCLYTCTNLKTVYSSSPYYNASPQGVSRPLADGSSLYVWSPTQKIVYDKSRYYESGSIDK